MEYSFKITYEDGKCKRSSVLYEADSVFQAMKFALSFFFPLHPECVDEELVNIYGVVYSIEIFVNFVSLDENGVPCIKLVSCGVLVNQENR